MMALMLQFSYTVTMSIFRIPPAQSVLPGFHDNHAGLWCRIPNPWTNKSGLTFHAWDMVWSWSKDHQDSMAQWIQAWHNVALERFLLGLAVPSASLEMDETVRIGWTLIGDLSPIEKAYDDVCAMWPWTPESYLGQFSGWLNAWTESRVAQASGVLSLPRTIGGSLGRRLANRVAAAPNRWPLSEDERVVVLQAIQGWREKAQLDLRNLSQTPGYESWVVRLRDVSDEAVAVSVTDETDRDLRHTVALRWGNAWTAWRQLLDGPEVLASGSDLDVFWDHELGRLHELGIEVQIPKRWLQHRLVVRPSIKEDWHPKTLDARQWLDVQWEVLLDGQTLSEEDLAKIAKNQTARIRWDQKWIVLSEDLVHRARTLLRTIHQPKQSLGHLYFEELSARRQDPSLVPAIRDRVQQLLGSGPDIDMEQSGFEGNLPLYQVEGVRWLRARMERNLGSLLADDMGLGKTVEVIAAIVDFWRQNAHRRAAILVVCPLSIASNWVNEWARFAPLVHVVLHSGRQRAPLALEHERTVVISTYDTVVRDRLVMAQVPWDGIVVDEAQHVKNRHTLRAQALSLLPAQWRIALTGTPIENRLLDLWAVMDLLNPGLLGSAQAFQNLFERPIVHGISEERQIVADELTRAVAPFVLRRTKSDPGIRDDLPAKTEQTEWVALQEEQIVLYRAVVDQFIDQMAHGDSLPVMARRGLILRAIGALKQIVNHPAQYLNQDIAQRDRSGKLMRLDHLLVNTLEEGHKVVIFTQYVRMATLLQTFCRDRYAVAVEIFHGGLSANMRDTVVGRFNQSSRPAILIASLKAGGVGLNLQSASRVIHYDRWWNPAVEDQATDRVWRLGQTEPVTSYKFVSRGTIEERIDALIEQKHYLTSLIMEPMTKRSVTEWSVGELRAWMELAKEYDHDS